jgi:hypothetical protein
MKSKNIFWGLFLVMSAALIIASQVTSFGTISAVSILATVFLAAIIISSIVRMEFFGIFVPMAFLYMIYDAPLELPFIRPVILVASAVLVSIGCSLLFRKRHKKTICAGVCGNNADHYNYNKTNESIDDNNPYVKVSMGASSKYLRADALQGGQFTASLGELEVYFDQVRLSPAGAQVYVDCSLASLKLYIPRHWNVIDKIGATLGEVKNNTRQAQPVLTEPPLTLTGNVKLGSVEINYV